MKAILDYIGMTILVAVAVAGVYWFVEGLAVMLSTHTGSIMEVGAVIFITVVAYNRLNTGYKWTAIVAAIAILSTAITFV